MFWFKRVGILVIGVWLFFLNFCMYTIFQYAYRQDLWLFILEYKDKYFCLGEILMLMILIRLPIYHLQYMCTFFDYTCIYIQCQYANCVLFWRKRGLKKQYTVGFHVCIFILTFATTCTTKHGGYYMYLHRAPDCAFCIFKWMFVLSLFAITYLLLTTCFYLYSTAKWTAKWTNTFWICH